MEEIIGTYEIYFRKGTLKKFLKLYKNIQKLNLDDLNLNTISSIRKKLILAYDAMRKHHQPSVIIKFSIYEYRYFLKIADMYLQQHHEKNKEVNEVQDEFNEFQKLNDKGSNND